MITAICIVSASELALAKPDFTYEWAESNTKELNELLYQFGMDITQAIEAQEGLDHRNRMNKIVNCTRWVGHERTDKDWINSGNASKEAKDKATGNRLIEDLYRSRGHY